MAVDMFMKIEDIKGESTDDKHKNSIDVLAWSWGLSQAGSSHSGGGSGSGKVNVQDISFTKHVDLSSPNLIKACAKGTHFKEALLTVRKAGDKPLEYIKIHLNNIIITSVSTGGSGGEDRLTENVTLNFAKFKFEYVPQDPGGKPCASLFAAYDISANKEC